VIDWTRENVVEVSMIWGWRRKRRRKVQSWGGTQTGAGRYIVMEQGPTTVDTWAWRKKRRQFYYFTNTTRSFHRPRRKWDASITASYSSLLRKFH
jgi:hypothetical protein